MRKPRGILGSYAANMKRKATMTATTGVYEFIFNEKPKRGWPKKKKENWYYCVLVLKKLWDRKLLRQNVFSNFKKNFSWKCTPPFLLSAFIRQTLMNLTDFLSEERATLQPQPPHRTILFIVDGLNFNQFRPTEKNHFIRCGFLNSSHILKLLHSQRLPSNSPTANRNKEK